MMRWLDGITDSSGEILGSNCEFEQTPGDSKGQGSLACCMGSMGSQRVRYDLATEHHHYR